MTLEHDKENMIAQLNAMIKRTKETIDMIDKADTELELAKVLLTSPLAQYSFK